MPVPSGAVGFSSKKDYTCKKKKRKELYFLTFTKSEKVKYYLA